MSFQEKSTWITTAAMIVVYGWYFANVFGQVDSVDAGAIGYQSMMLVTVGALVVFIIVGNVVVALANPREVEKSDDRDREINRRGEFIGGYVLGTGALAALALAMVEVEHFWIANAILLALVLSEVVTGASKIVLYRRGI
ncbi:MAG: hypothetical protein PVG83_10730 [Acidimicrobiia bacterium]|jgi:hypothetical protein